MKHLTTLLLIMHLSFLISKGQLIRTMTYNIRYDNAQDSPNSWDERKVDLSKQIFKYSPDVLGVQEAMHHQLEFLVKNLPGYRYVGVGRDDGEQKGEYSAIIYNANKFKPDTSGTFWLSKTPETPSKGWDAAFERICTFAKFYNKEDATSFWVFNAHFDHIGPLARQKSAELILSMINQYTQQKEAVIVMGDFNVAPSPLDIGIGEVNAKRWLKEGKTAFLPEEIEMWNSIKNLGFIDSWREQNPSEDSIYSWFDYRSRMFDDTPKRGLRIDHIMISKNLVPAMKETGIDYEARAMEKPSDHCPVWIELK